MSHIVEPKNDLSDISQQLAVILEKISNTNYKISELKDDMKEDIVSISNKIDVLSDRNSNLTARISTIEYNQNELEEKLLEISLKQKIIETRYTTIVNIFKVGVPCSVALVSLVTGLVYLFKYLL